MRTQGHGRWLAGILLLAGGASILIAGHGAVLYYVSSHAALSTTAVSGVIALMALKHLGLLGWLYAAVRRHLRTDAD